MMLRTFAALGLGSLVAASAITTAGLASVETNKKKTRATDDTRRPIVNTENGLTDSIGLPVITGRPMMKTSARSAEVRPVDMVPKKATASLQIPVDPKTGESLATGTLTIKFRDDLKARAGVVAGDRALSLLGQDLTSVDNIVAKYGANIRQLIMLPQTSIDIIEQKAFTHSNRRQPDLASMMRIEFPAGTQENLILAAAREFNERPELQWVTVDLKLKTAMGPPPQGCDAMNEVICNRPNRTSDPVECWDGLDTTPAPFIGACNPAPGDDDNARYGCADAACCELVSQFNENCNEEDAGEGWDVYCAGLANLYCEGSVYSNDNIALTSPDRYDPCLSTYDPDAAPGGAAGDPTPVANDAQLNPVFANIAGFLLGSCFEPHPAPGCLKPDCCASVCVVDPACCSIDWDENCVAVTTTFPDACTPDVASVATASYTSSVDANGQTIGQQAYTSAPKVADDWLLQGIFDGGGYDLAGMEDLIGKIWRSYGSGATNGGIIPNPDKVWLYGAEYQVVTDADVAAGNVTPEEFASGIQILPEVVVPRGPDNPFPSFASDPNFTYSTIRLLQTGERIQGAVVEFAAFVNHEDLQLVRDANGNYVEGVITEPGPTIALLDQSFNNHGTACLGTMGAINNGFGVRGIASGAEMWFFPTVSIEDGARLETAMASVIQNLDPGAVINYSIGAGGGAMLTSLAGPYTLIRSASDAGLITSISAGNDCVPILDEAGDDSGAMIVGAINPGMETGPGAPPCNTQIRRASFSNYTDGGATVTINAWGLAGTTPGYGDLFNGNTSLQPNGSPYIPARDLDPLEVNNLRSYSAQFNGTSFASPQNAGAAIWMQGVAMMFFDTTLTGEQMRGAVLTAGRENCTTLGPNSFGNDDPCGGDFIVQEQANPVGIYPNLPACGVQVITRVGVGYSGKIRVYHGTLVRGSILSLGADDGNKIVIRSDFAGQGSAVDGIAYLATGETTDIGVMFNSGWLPEEVENAQLEVVAQATASVVIQVAWVKNVSTDRFQILGADIMTGFESPFFYDLGATLPAPNYFGPTGRVDVRLYSVALGFIGVPSYQVKYDLLALRVNDLLQGPNDP